MRNIKIIVEYDGTYFHGWQYQSHCRSVQGVFIDAVKQITGEAVVVEGAGRTDTGVHARGQVANFKIKKPMALDALMKGMNAVLPTDARVTAIHEVPMDFHARFSAKERRYKYSVTQRPVAVGRFYHWFYPHPLDLVAMRQAAAFLIGEKDFRSFCLSEAEVTHYLCDVRLAHWQVNDPILTFEIHANRFLHNMVRALVGTMISVGRGKISARDIPGILESKDRRKAGFTAPAHGLSLEEVIY